jgi:RND family efflux transporter MFP subunit
MKQLAYVFILLTLAACGGKKPADKNAELADLKKQQATINARIAELEEQTGKKDSGRVVDVAVSKIAPSTFTSYIEVQGSIDAPDNVTANAEAAGIITAIYVKAGDAVKKGQVIAQLDTKALQQQILQVQSQVDLANTLYERQKNLWDQKIGTEVQFLQAKTNLEIVQKQLAGLKAQASMYRIVAPISGTLDQMDLKIGQAVQPGTQGIRIVNLSSLKVKAPVAETYAAKVNQGDKVMVVIPDAADSLSSSVSYASKVIDPASRSFIVEVKLPQEKYLKPNMTAVLRIVDYSKAGAIVIPVKAIQKSVDGEYVYLAVNNKAKRVAVKTGNSYNGEAEVLSGIRTGDQVIVEGALDIEDGDAVRIAGDL